MKKTIPTLLLLLFISYFAHSQSKHLWATTTTGGANGYGTILEGNDDGTGFHTVFSFADTNGSYPEGKMVQCSNGNLYFTTFLGGYQDSCCICCYNPDSGTLTVLYEFMYEQQYGWNSYSGMIMASNGKFYGMTTDGGANDWGVIYSFDPATGVYTDVYDFDGGTHGSSPETELLLANDGKLYGITPFGGANGTGIIFRFDPTGGGLTVLYNFDSACNDGNIYADLIQASNGLLYGITNGNGRYGHGVLFSFDPVSLNYTDVHDFGQNSSSLDPPSTGLLQTSNGKLYGMTGQGGAYGLGEIYSYDPSQNTFAVVANFDSTIGNTPQRALSQISNGMLMGSTMYGGFYQVGTIFSFNTTTNKITDLLDLNSATTGSWPSCEVYESTDMPSSIQQIMMKNMTMSPNPASDMINIQNAQAGTPITITNAAGELILQTKATSSNAQINVSGLAPGVYMLNGTKFVKE